VVQLETALTEANNINDNLNSMNALANATLDNLKAVAGFAPNFRAQPSPSWASRPTTAQLLRPTVAPNRFPTFVPNSRMHTVVGGIGLQTHKGFGGAGADGDEGIRGHGHRDGESIEKQETDETVGGAKRWGVGEESMACVPGRVGGGEEWGGEGGQWREEGVAVVGRDEQSEERLCTREVEMLALVEVLQSMAVKVQGLGFRV
jgi:hypothetical protein